MDLIALIKEFLPESVSAGAVITVVWMFLKQLNLMGDACHAKALESQHLFQVQIKSVTDQFSEESRQTRAEIKNMSGAIHDLKTEIKISREVHS